MMGEEDETKEKSIDISGAKAWVGGIVGEWGLQQ